MKNVQLKVKVKYIHSSGKVKVKNFQPPQGECEGKEGPRGEGRVEELFQPGPRLLGLRSGNISVYSDQQDEDDHHHEDDHHPHHHLHHDHQDDHLWPRRMHNKEISVDGDEQDGEGGECDTHHLHDNHLCHDHHHDHHDHQDDHLRPRGMDDEKVSIIGDEQY